MVDLNKYFNLWKRALTNPAATFKAEIKKASLNEYARNYVLAGLIIGFITGIVAAFGLGRTFGTLSGMTAFVTSIVAWPILLVLGGLIGSGIYYIFAMLLGGKGNYTQQTYLISTYSAPLTILVVVLGLIPILGFVIDIIIGIYGLYLLTLALKQAHNFDTGKAILVWLIPSAIALLLVAVVAAAFFSVIASQFGTGLTL